MIFRFFGHSNLLGTHKNTLEFTKSDKLSKKGDCIVGVRADFLTEELKRVVSSYPRLRIVIDVSGITDEIVAVPNKDFNSEHEIVIRKTEFLSERTLGIKADKAACDIDRKLIESLKNPECIGKVIIQGLR